MKIEKMHPHSRKVEIDDLDWDLASSVGLSDDEILVLTYFADIEGQTIFYLREILATRAALEPEVIGFITMWNYEEYFHSLALARMLEVCGVPLGDARNSANRRTVKIRAKIEAAVQYLLSRIFAPQFPALYMAWGASQELLTLRGYEQIMETTRNPVLRTLCDRIAKQERRHFAWYFNSARERLNASRVARVITRKAFDYWTPVGVGVKTTEESYRLAVALFGDRLGEVAEHYDKKMETLPGLDGKSILRRFAQEVEEALGSDSEPMARIAA